jgi:hypothetical protein
MEASMSDLNTLFNNVIRDSAEWMATGFTANMVFSPSSLAEWRAAQTPEKSATFEVTSRESGSSYTILVLSNSDSNTFLGMIQPTDLVPPKGGTESPWMQAVFTGVQVNGQTLIRVTPYIWHRAN